MEKMDERMEKIASAILDQSSEESKKIIAKANRIRLSELSAYEDEAIASMYAKLQRKSKTIRLEYIKKAAQAELVAKRDILKQRLLLTESVFSSVNASLVQYTAGTEYRQKLLADISSLVGSYDHSHSTVFLKQDDLSLADKIGEILGSDCKVAVDKKIKIGGFLLLNSSAGVLIDQTLDTVLQQQRPWFLQHCQMKTM